MRVSKQGKFAMWRVCAVVLTAYNCGHPNLEIVRPGVFDRPLANFHDDMDTVVAQGVRIIEQYTNKTMQFVRTGAEWTGTGLKIYFHREDKS
jgi:hypothetical protein